MISALYLIRDPFLYNNMVFTLYIHTHSHTFTLLLSRALVLSFSFRICKPNLMGFVQTQDEAKTMLKIYTLFFFFRIRTSTRSRYSTGQIHIIDRCDVGMRWNDTIGIPIGTIQQSDNSIQVNGMYGSRDVLLAFNLLAHTTDVCSLCPIFKSLFCEWDSEEIYVGLHLQLILVCSSTHSAAWRPIVHSSQCDSSW